MEKYYLIYSRKLVKGEVKKETDFLVNAAWEYVNKEWVEISPNEINDRIMGYDPSEVDMYSMYNEDIRAEIESITEEEARRFMEKT